MDFTGIAWAGHVYQKFEAMCLEVEEVMYQDTVKYMENQVQKVGGTVKKFYSEVMDDLLPPSFGDPTNLASGDFSVYPYGHTNVNRKPILDSHRDFKKKENEDQVINNATAKKESRPSGYYDVNSLPRQSPGILVQNKLSDSSKRVGVYKRPVGIKRISKNSRPSKDSCQTTSLSGDRRSEPPSSDMRISSKMPSNDINVVSSSDLDTSGEPEQTVKGNAPIRDAPIESPADKLLSAETVRQNKDDSNCDSRASDNNISAEPESVRLKGDSELTSYCYNKILYVEPVRQSKDDSDCNSPAPYNKLSAESKRLKRGSELTSSCCELPAESTGTTVNDSSSVRSEAHNLESEEKDVMVSNEGICMKDGLSSVGTNSCGAESWEKDIVVSNEDGFDMELIENEEVAEPRLENLGESCVLVDHFVPEGTSKHKSYKKKIGEAISSKLRSKKDNERVTDHRDLGIKKKAEVAIPVLAMVSEKHELPADDSFESDWELL